MQLTLGFEDDPAPLPGRAKALGAYYTDAQVADFLAWWAIRSRSDTVMDPCFGGGVFLRAACRRIREFGGRPQESIFGVEVDAGVFTRIAAKLADEFLLNRKHLLCDDFFNVDPKPFRLVNAIIGNPPFIRYQRFSTDARNHAFARVVSQGVHLPKLSSSWALFLVHSIAMLRPGGRLAMVLPMEVAHAKYARPVLDHLRKSFEETTFLTFRSKLFADLNEDTVLVLAEGKTTGIGRFLLRDLAHPGLLTGIVEGDDFDFGGSRNIDAENIASGKNRLIEHFLPAKARDLYRELKTSSLTRKLGQLADVGIGYVTGANDFFHLSPDEILKRRIPREFLKPAVRRGRALSGLKFTTNDWKNAAKDGEAGYLLSIQKDQELPQSIKAYVEMGRVNGVAEAYKCRTRTPWFSVPHVYKPDAFLSYMSGDAPRFVSNRADAYAPNSLHIIRIHSTTLLSPDSMAALWHTSLTRLSVEIEGHPLGGGMLKLEPTEAGNVLLPFPQMDTSEQLLEISQDLDLISRKNSGAVAVARADEQILHEIMGLSRSDCQLLKSAAETLRARRGYRSSTNELT
jgi:adenine-specific DNA-methyltransferase